MKRTLSNFKANKFFRMNRTHFGFDNQHDLTSDTFYIAEKDNEPPFSIIEKPRIGVHYAKEWANELLRFYIMGNAYVSKL